MQLAALRQIVQWKPKDIQAYCKSISSNFVKKLRQDGIHIESDNQRANHMFGIKLPKHVDVESLKNTLKEQKIYLSFRGDYLRLSCHLFNTKKDFDLLYTSLSKHL